MPEKKTIVLDEHRAQLGDRLLRLLARMRSQSLTAVELFVESAERETGGPLVVQAPSSLHGRDLPEAGYRTEAFQRLAG